MLEKIPEKFLEKKAREGGHGPNSQGGENAIGGDCGEKYIGEV